MSTRVMFRGRQVYASRDYQKFQPSVRPLDKDGEHIDVRPIVTEGSSSGVPYRDPEDGLVYRLVPKLDVSEGWGTASFWMSRYAIDYNTVVEFVERGWLEGAIELGSPTKRYRLRDEPRMMEHLGLNPNLIRQKKPPKRPSRAR